MEMETADVVGFKRKMAKYSINCEQTTKSLHRFVNKYVSELGLFCLILQARIQAQNLVLV